LRNNQLTGAIPTEFGNLKSLKEMWIIWFIFLKMILNLSKKKKEI